MPETPSKTYSLASAAAVMGVRRETLYDWINRRGCPFVTRGDGTRGIVWEISIPAVIDWRINGAVERALSGYQDESGKISKDEADRRRAVAQAITAEVAADEALDMVVARPDAEAAVAEFCMALKSGLSNANSRIASRAVSMASAPDIQRLCETELNRAFDAATAELTDKWLRGAEDMQEGDDASRQG
ncbi:MAG: Terminase small subunit (DNA packaging protein Nu1) [bacterium]